MKKNFAFSFVVFSFCFILLFFSCSRQGRNALGAELDRIDTFITLGQYRDAISELKKIEKRLMNSWDFIGVYRRYAELGESDRAVQIIQDAFKKFDKNAEIRAIYTHSLLRSGKFNDAVEIATPLQGTRYGSFYAEALLKQAAAKTADGSKGGDTDNTDADSNALSNYLQPELFSVYYDAYTGSRNSYWLRNAAIVGMTAGNMEQVRALHPERYASFSDAFFWSLIQYDSGNYGDAEQSLMQARALYQDASRRDRSRVSDAEFVALLSDVYQALSENDRAEEIRQSLLSDKAAQTEGVREKTMPYIYVNSAQWAEGNGDDERASKLLLQTVSNWPDFVPGLISYANFACRTAESRTENPTQRALRESGVATREMQRYDNRAQIPVADAIARMDSSLEKSRDPLLYIARQDLIYKTDKTLSNENKIAELWNILERNTTGINEYPQLLFEYAVNMLVRYNRVDDAFGLFKRYCSSHYAFDPATDFWEQISAKMSELTPREIEYAAWFAANQGLGSTAQKFYETCVWQDASVSANRRQILAGASVQACINLAMIYSSIGNRAAALELYAAAAGRTPDAVQKAEIMYRMATIYDAERKPEEALRTVATACALNPAHARAQLLYSRLSAR